ncbi:MAG: cation diffusion facilitator family transporter [Gammaproteobacteria bacterium]
MAAHHHGHRHGHQHHAHHGAREESRAIGIAFFLNLAFTLVEIVGGLLTNSVAILADALHDLGDSLALGLSWLLARVARREADAKFSYGYQRFSLLGALVNSVVLLAGSAFILIEAVPRLWAPQMPHAQGMFWLAILGVVVNGVAAWRLRRSGTLNAQAMGWHLLEDVLGWVAVLIVSVVLMFVDWPILDPLLSVVFTLFILLNVLRTLRATVAVFLQAVPDGHLIPEIEESLLEEAAVSAVHHSHLWTLDGERHVFTAHLVATRALDGEAMLALKARIEQRLAAYGFAHTTIEIEQPGESCRDRCCDRGEQPGPESG